MADIDVESVLSKLTLSEKVDLLSGKVLFTNITSLPSSHIPKAGIVS